MAKLRMAQASTQAAWANFKVHKFKLLIFPKVYMGEGKFKETKICT